MNMKLKQLTAFEQEAEFISLDITDSDELEHSLDSDYEEIEDKEDTRDSLNKREPDNTPDPNYRLLSAYFKDLSSEGLLKKRDEAVLASKIKICNEKTQRINQLLESEEELSFKSYHRNFRHKLGDALQSERRRLD